MNRAESIVLGKGVAKTALVVATTSCHKWHTGGVQQLAPLVQTEVRINFSMAHPIAVTVFFPSSSLLRTSSTNSSDFFSTRPKMAWGAYKPHKHLSSSNLTNAALCFVLGGLLKTIAFQLISDQQLCSSLIFLF